MKLIIESWKRFLKESEEDFKPHMMYDPNSDDKKKAEKVEDHEEMAEKGYTHVDPEELRKVLKDEGGASGVDPFLEALPDSDEEEIKNTLDAMEDVGQHEDGDYILDDDKEIIVNIIKEEIRFILEKRKKKKKKGNKICPKGIAWAKRNYDKWPSAYASMGASKYCKDTNYGKDKKTNEGALEKWRDQNWTQSDGTPCGDAKAQSNPKRCKPASKWATMSSGEKKADNAKKRAGGKKGKQFVKATKKGEVKNA